MTVLNKLGGIRLPALVALFAAVMMLFCLFLPYAVANEETSDMLEEYSDVVINPEWEMTGADMQSLSITTLTLKLNDYYQGAQDELGGIILIALLAACALLCLLTILFPLMNRAIPTIIVALLSFGPFYLLSLIMNEDWGVGATGGSYAWGVGYYLFHAAVVVAIGGAVWLLVEKMKEKKAKK